MSRKGMSSCSSRGFNIWYSSARPCSVRSPVMTTRSGRGLRPFKVSTQAAKWRSACISWLCLPACWICRSLIWAMSMAIPFGAGCDGGDAGADDQPVGQLLAACAALFDLLQQQVAGRFADLVTWRFDGGQAGRHEGAVADAVESRHRDVVGHRPAQFLDAGNDGGCQQVVGTEERAGPRRGLKKVADGLCVRASVAGHDGMLYTLQAQFHSTMPGAGQTGFCAVRQVQRAADESNVPVTQFRQVPDHVRRGGMVVDGGARV